MTDTSTDADVQSAPAKKPKKKPTEPTGPVKGLSTAADGHTLLDGAVWHTPKSGSPTECEIPTCDKVLGLWRTHDPLATFDEPDETDSTEETEAA